MTPSSASILEFDEPDLAGAVESMAPELIDALPFGAIRLDSQNRVIFYSNAEASLSGYGSREALGRDFFQDMAPCMRGPGFRGRVEAARAAGTLDLEFGWIGDFSDRDRALRVRVQSTRETSGGIWIFMLRED